MNNVFITQKELMNAYSHSVTPLFHDSTTLEKAVEIANASITPKFVVRDFDFNIEKNDLNEKLPIININGATLRIPSKSLATHFANSSKIAMFCATLGRQPDFEIEKAKVSDIQLAVLLNFAYLELIEKFCDEISNNLSTIAEKENMFTTPRFSLGYGDTSLNFQKSFLDVLNAEKVLGIQLTDGNMMLPSKTVSAFVGYCKNYKSKK